MAREVTHSVRSKSIPLVFERFAFWVSLALPFPVAALSDNLARIFAIFVPEVWLAYSFFIFLNICFVTFTILFHYCAFLSGPRVIGKKTINKCIAFIDYIWYFFGGIFLSYFAIAEFQDRFFSRDMENLNRTARANELRLQGSFLALNPSCRIVLERSTTDGDFREEFQDFIVFCHEIVANRHVGPGFEVACEKAVWLIETRPVDELLDLKILRRARGREINELTNLCNNAKHYEHAAADYRAAASNIKEKIGGDSRPPFEIFALLTALVALKFTKVTAGIRNSG